MGWAIGGGFLLIWVLSLWQSLSKGKGTNLRTGVGFADNEGFAMEGGHPRFGTRGSFINDEFPAVVGGSAIGVKNDLFGEEDNYDHLSGRVGPSREVPFDVNQATGLFEIESTGVNPATGLLMIGSLDTGGNFYGSGSPSNFDNAYGSSRNFDDPF